MSGVGAATFHKGNGAVLTKLGIVFLQCLCWREAKVFFLSETLTSAPGDVCLQAMRASFSHSLFCVAVSLLLVTSASFASREKSEAEAAAWSMARPLETEEFSFRAEAWEKELKPEMGKAVRVQLFKGNDYRFSIAVPVDSGVHITATVLDGDGKPLGQLQAVEQGWGVVLSFKPKRTGVYAVAIRQTDKGKSKAVPCAMLTGYK